VEVSGVGGPATRAARPRRLWVLLARDVGSRVGHGCSSRRRGRRTPTTRRACPAGRPGGHPERVDL